jgi:hypothetical protein
MLCHYEWHGRGTRASDQGPYITCIGLLDAAAALHYAVGVTNSTGSIEGAS